MELKRTQLYNKITVAMKGLITVYSGSRVVLMERSQGSIEIFIPVFYERVRVEIMAGSSFLEVHDFDKDDFKEGMLLESKQKADIDGNIYLQ